MPTILLLSLSNVFMTAAWYGHLKDPSMPLARAVIIGWGIAFFEYCLAVPANRLGYANGYSAAQLKIMQEVITLAVFAVFAWVWLGERLTWRYGGAAVCMAGAVAFLFAGRKG
jgi:uncharacterized protein (DUF486 family)